MSPDIPAHRTPRSRPPCAPPPRASSAECCGSVFILRFTVEGLDVGKSAMLPRFGVHSVLDTPRLVFLDQSKPADVNRQVVRIFAY